MPTILLLLLFITPLLYKALFWLYTLQLKEYRWDRFREYALTPQWRNAFLNFWFLIEIPILIFAFTIFYEPSFWSVSNNMVFYLLILENIFVIWKFFRLKILKPKFTLRASILFISFIVITLNLLILNLDNIFFNIILLLISLFPYILYFITNLLFLPLFNHSRNKIIKKASLKSKEFSSPIKIAITWSFWKSSVKEFLSSILEQDWKILKTPDNINSELWVARVILNKLDNTYKYFVAEIWAYRIGEIKTLWKIVNHKYWFLTAIWTQHLWLFGNIENTKKAKSEIVKKILKNSWTLYANFDNKNIQAIDFDKKLKIVKYWLDIINLDAKSGTIKVKNWITSFEFKYKWITTKFKTSLVWRHNILNLTWVLAFCVDMWIDIKELKKYVKNIVSPNNILKIVEIDEAVVIDDTYNLSEDWLLAWIEVLNSFEWNKILVMDDILELWKQSKKIHFKLWKKIAKSNSVHKIMYVWVNFKKDFYYWLNDWGFDISNNIINSLDNINKWDIVLLEWKWSKKIFKK